MEPRIDHQPSSCPARPAPTRCRMAMAAVLAVCAATAGTAETADTPTGQLEREHRLIAQVADAAMREAGHLQAGGDLDSQRLDRFRQFFVNFADTCHHAKEDRFYFTAALLHGGEDADLLRRRIEALRTEHQQGQAMMQELAAALSTDPVDRRLAAERLEAYARMIDKHIDRENELLYPLARAHLPAKENRALMAGFRYIEHTELGDGFHQRYKGLAQELISGTASDGVTEQAASQPGD